MTEEQEKAIDDLRFFYQGEYITREMEESAKVVLEMLEEKDKEIRNLKDEINEAWGEWNDLEQTAYEEETRLKTELEKKDKIINLMAEAFKQDDARSVEEIIEYFENKVKENEDEI